MNADEIINKAQNEFARLSKLPVNTVIGLSKAEGEWVVVLEALERRAIPDTMDVLGLYEVHLDNEGNLLGFNRKRLRKRGETEEE
jgi:nitrate reductase NapAB chaperone NapD